MKRRDFLYKLSMAAGLGAIPGLSLSSAFAQTSFAGKLLFCLQLDGGMDVTSFCDPKMNVAGEEEINIWARSDEIRSAGNISYAPFASNQALFDKYYQDMLVINGVDAQTNSHSVGVVHNWSGRNSEGFPSLTALYAASNASQLPLSYLNFGGFGATQEIIRSSRISEISEIRNILFPNNDQWNPGIQYRRTSDFARIRAAQIQSAQRLAAESDLIAGNRENRQYFAEALGQVDNLGDFAASIPSDDQLQAQRTLSQSMYSNLHQQIQISLLAMKAGVTVAVDLYEGGYDTHQDHDADHTLLLNNLSDAIDYFWTYAEELGLADRVVLVMGSDFGRTPHYNASNGKDHWPIGSYVIMERNVNFTNRVFGETDAGHNAYPVNLVTGVQDYIDGVRIHPKHVHKALRQYLGIYDNEYSSTFPFNNTEDFPFFTV